MAGVYRAEQVPGLLNRKAGFSVSGVPRRQGVEKVAQGVQDMVLGRAVPGELVDEASGKTRESLRCCSSHQVRRRLTTRA